MLKSEKEKFIREHSRKSNQNKVNSTEKSPYSRLFTLIRYLISVLMIILSLIMGMTTLSFYNFVNNNIGLYNKLTDSMKLSGINIENYFSEMKGVSINGSKFTFEMLAKSEFYTNILVLSTVICILITILILVSPYIVTKIKRKMER